MNRRHVYVGHMFNDTFIVDVRAPEVTVHTYAGGHATYTDDTARRQFQADVAKFVQSAVSK